MGGETPPCNEVFHGLCCGCDDRLTLGQGFARLKLLEAGFCLGKI